MRYVVGVFVIVCCSWWSPARAQELFHVRSLDAWASESIQRGLADSSVFRNLVNELSQTDVIVHVETLPTLPSPFAGMTRLAADAGDYRYVRITLDRRLDPMTRAASLAHELQHAVELAESGVRTQPEMLDLLLRIGHRTGGQRAYYETAAAQEVAAQVWVELRGGTLTAQ